MATWTWALLYVREQETDGYLPEAALRGSWVSETEARRHAAKLVEVGLWERDAHGPDGGGWRICRYSDKNETKATITERREEAAERMRRVRANRVRTTGERSQDVPGSGSGSDLRSEDPDLPTIIPRAIWHLDSKLPDNWREDARAQVEPTGATVDLPGEWRLYLADRMRPEQAKLIGLADWRGWVLRAIKFASEKRERDRERAGRPDTRQQYGGASAAGRRAFAPKTGTES